MLANQAAAAEHDMSKTRDIFDNTQLPDNWPDREAWLRKELAECPSAIIEQEVKFARAAFERSRQPDPVMEIRRADLDAALEDKTAEQRRRFLTDWYSRPL